MRARAPDIRLVVAVATDLAPIVVGRAMTPSPFRIEMRASPQKTRTARSHSKDETPRGTTLVPHRATRPGVALAPISAGAGECYSACRPAAFGSRGSEMRVRGTGCWITPYPALFDPATRVLPSSSPLLRLSASVTTPLHFVKEISSF